MRPGNLTAFKALLLGHAALLSAEDQTRRRVLLQGDLCAGALPCGVLVRFLPGLAWALVTGREPPFPPGFASSSAYGSVS